MKRLIMILLFLGIAFSGLLAQQYVEIGTGSSITQYIPLYGYYDYSWSSYILTSDQIGNALDINQIQFNVSNNPSNYVTNNQQIYMKLTSETELTDAYPDPENNGFNLVFNGSITWNGTGWQGVMLDNEFSYDGTSNLQIVYLNNDGSWEQSFPKFFSTESENNICAYKYSDNNFPLTSGTTRSFYPNTRLGFYLEGIAETPTIIWPLNNSSNIGLTSELVWSFGDNTDFIHVYLSNNQVDVINNETSALLVDGDLITSFSPALEYDLVYYWRVVASNSTTDYLAQTPVYSFITEINLMGQGTQENPYLINDIDDLITLSNVDYIWDKHFTQTADIDASETSEINAGSGFMPIGREDLPFQGVYDGQGYKITNLNINRPTSDYIGLFGRTWTATISNLSIKDGCFVGSNYVGSIVGSADYYSEINQSSSTSIVNGGDCVGGLIGKVQSNSQLHFSSASGPVTGILHVGGLVGEADDFIEISNSYALGNVTGNVNIGGLIGCLNNFSYVSDSYAVGNVAGNDYVGGLLGRGTSNYAQGSFWNTEASEQTTNSLGIGKTTSQMQDITTYLNENWNFEEIWSIHPEVNSGYPFLISNYISDVSINNYAYNISLNPTISFTINPEFYHYELYFASNPNPETAIIPFNSTSNPVNYTFTDSLDYFTDYYWTLVLYDADNEISILDFTFKTRPDMDGLGTEDNPYLISSLNDLVMISSDTYFWDKHLLQTTNIDASETTEMNQQNGFSPIGNDDQPFTGSYDGQNYSISNLYISRPSTSYVALFGYTNSATISNLGIADADIVGDNYVGLLTAYASSTTLSKSYSTGSVTGNEKVGGLVGEANFSSIINSYAASLVTGSGDYVGGLLAFDSSSTVSNSFWDTELSQLSISAGGLGKTSLEMKSPDTYTNAGWDFIGEETNGTEDIWIIQVNRNSGYPTHFNSLTLPDYPQYRYPFDGQMNNATSDNLIWTSDSHQLATGYKLSLGTDNPPTNVFDNVDQALNTYYEYSNLQANTNYYWQVLPYNDNGLVEDSPVWSFTTGSINTVSVGRGVDNFIPLPISHANIRSYSQSIYLQSELNFANRHIEILSFYLTDDFDLTGANEWEIYLGHTSKNEFANANDWMLTNHGLTQVADITFDNESDIGWIDIELDNPFAYNNIDNLVVGIIEYSPEQSDSLDFYTVETNSNRSLSFGHDSLVLNTNVPYNGQLVNSIPKINFTFSEPSTILGGIVTNSSGIPISNSTIEIDNFLTIHSDENGVFQVVDIIPGHYQLTISAPWYETQNSNITIYSGQSINLDISLLEELLPANNVQAVIADDLTNVQLTWSQPTLAREPNKNEFHVEKTIVKQKGVLDQRTVQPQVVYNLYRYQAEDENFPLRWSLIATNLSDTSYEDYYFPELDLNTYYWAVQAVYSNNRQAQYSISNEIIKQPHIHTNIENELDFGPIYLTDGNENEEREIVISNLGPVPLTITEITCDETAFNLIYDSDDFLLEANSTMTLQIIFSPENLGQYIDELEIFNNSVNAPSYTLTLKGSCQYIPPAEPQGLQVIMQSNTAQISWTPVTEDIYENSITPDMYIIYYNGQNTQDDNDFYFLQSTTDHTYNHVNVGAFSNFMFYRIKAYVDMDDSLLNNINELIHQKKKVTNKDIDDLLRRKQE